MPVDYNVYLYEDNAGNLFVYPAMSNWVYQVDPFQIDTTFVQDAQALAKNEAQCRGNWSKEWVHGHGEISGHLHHPETRIIAGWSTVYSLEVYLQPGRAGQHYLRRSEES